MARKRKNVSGRMLFTCLLLAGLIALLSPKNLTGNLQLAFARIFRLPLNISRSLTLSASTSQPLKLLDNHKQAQAENHIANLQAQLENQLKENARLRRLQKEYPLLNASFVYGDITQATDTELTIDCGSTKGIAEGQFVLGDNSIIGSISKVAAHTAKVRLINSPLSRTPVIITDTEAILQGDKSNKIKIPLLSTKQHKITVGQQVFCRPKTGFLTAPIIIGKVSDCKTDPANPLLWDITVEPASKIESLTSVDVIVLDKNPQGQ